MEIRESKSFETLIDFLAFLVEKLWHKINKIINYLFFGLTSNFVVVKLTLLNPKS